MKKHTSDNIGNFDEYLVINKMDGNTNLAKIKVPLNAIKPFNMKTDIIRDKKKKLFVVDEDVAKMLEGKL